MTINQMKGVSDVYIDGIGPVEPSKPVEGTEGSKKEKLKGIRERDESSRVDTFRRGDTAVIDRLKKKMENVEAVRFDLVKELKRAVESGEYVVDVSRLASKILEEMRGEEIVEE
ncbi:MAG: flagellar biosynthesis anti-sigma factor FlgM [Thermotogae bacterium]|nr:flagellar biosynthesis anti-sigma factor FlgM [Thermotogota bacterium]